MLLTLARWYDLEGIDRTGKCGSKKDYQHTWLAVRSKENGPVSGRSIDVSQVKWPSCLSSIALPKAYQ
jgi:hypothetical protein